MAIVDVKVVAWLGFYQKVGNVYHLRLRCAPYIALAGNPLLSLGASYVTLDPAVSFDLQQAFRSIPKNLSTGQKIPYVNGSGEYTIPEDLKLDYATSPCIVSNGNYISATMITWNDGDFWEIHLFYISKTGTFTEIPGSIPNHTKFPLYGTSAYFAPLKTSLWYATKTIAHDHGIFGDEYAYSLYGFQFPYDGVDLPDLHVLVLAGEEKWWLTDPVGNWIGQRYRAGGAHISDAVLDARGFEMFYEASGSNYSLRMRYWKSDDPVEYKFFPPRESFPWPGNLWPVFLWILGHGFVGEKSGFSIGRTISIPTTKTASNKAEGGL